MVAPGWSIAISDDPILHFCNWISAPTYNNHGVVQVLPRYSIILEVMVGDFILLFFFIGPSLCKTMELLMQLLDAIRGQNTLSVHTEDVRSLKLAIDDTVSHNFLHHFLLRRVTVAFANEISALDLSEGLAFRVVAALVALSYSFIRSAFFGDEMALLTKVSMEEWPASITTFVHIVASHEELWWKKRHLFTVFELESLLGNLSERNGVARSTMALVSVLVGEIVATNASPVKVLRQLIIRNLISRGVLLLELQSLFVCFFEVLTISECLWFRFSLCKFLWLNFFVAVSAILMMMLLVLAGICLPAELHLVDKLNQHIVVIRGHMSMMSIVSLVWLSQENEVVIRRAVTDLNLFNSWRCILWDVSQSSIWGNLVAFLVFLLGGLSNVLVLSLFSIKALHGVLLHSSWSASLLNETNHSLGAVRVESGIVTSFSSLELCATISNRVLTEIWLHVVPKIGNESETIVKLNAHSLIVNGTPSSWGRLSIARCICNVVVLELYLPDLFLGKLELMLFVNNLYVIWLHMGADFMCREQVNVRDFFRDVELPLSIDVISKTVNRLICLHTKGVKVCQEAKNCERWSH